MKRTRATRAGRRAGDPRSRGVNTARTLPTEVPEKIGWAPDPFNRFPSRCWDGQQWTDQVLDHSGRLRRDPSPLATTEPDEHGAVVPVALERHAADPLAVAPERPPSTHDGSRSSDAPQGARRSGRPATRSRRTAALIGVIGVAVALGVTVVLRHRNGVDEASPRDAASALHRGDCVDVVMRVVPCSGPHIGEVFFVGRDRSDAASPRVDEAAFRARVERTCSGPFTSYVGVPHERSVYDLRVRFPSETQWSAGSRDIVCFVAYHDLAPLPERVRGTGE
jgi:Septum formation